MKTNTETLESAEKQIKSAIKKIRRLYATTQSENIAIAGCRLDEALIACRRAWLEVHAEDNNEVKQ